MWGAYLAIIAIAVVLFQFLPRRNVERAFFLLALWLFLGAIVDIITALIIVNVATFSKPDADVSDDNP